jgi:kynurenine formamidase
MPDEVRTALYTVKENGFTAHRYEIVGQWGTHVDPPSHYIENGRPIDKILVDEMLLPLVIFDVRQMAAEDPDYALKLEDVRSWEERNDRVPPGAFAALRSGWALRWPDSEAMQNKDELGTSHFPGWSVEALKFLCEERGITACGHETTDTDPGYLVSQDRFPAETYLLSQGKYQIELLASLAQLPDAGAIIVAAFPKPEGGSGFPARVFAITA